MEIGRCLLGGGSLNKREDNLNRLHLIRAEKWPRRMSGFQDGSSKPHSDILFGVTNGDNEERQCEVTCFLGRILICNDALSPLDLPSLSTAM